MPIMCQLSAWGTYYRQLYFPDQPIIGTMCDFACNFMMARWFLVKFLWEVQSLDNFVSQKFYEDEVSCSRNIQVRRKSILVSNTKLFLHNSMLNQNGLYSALTTIITK